MSSGFFTRSAKRTGERDSSSARPFFVVSSPSCSRQTGRPSGIRRAHECMRSVTGYIATPHANASGVKVECGDGCVAAVRPAHDADAIAIGESLCRGPVRGVDQIVVHLRAPLAVAGVKNLFRNRQCRGTPRGTQVAAIGEELEHPVRRPRVPRIRDRRPAVHDDDHRQMRTLRSRDPRGPVEIAGQVDSVARLVLDGFAAQRADRTRVRRIRSEETSRDALGGHRRSNAPDHR